MTRQALQRIRVEDRNDVQLFDTGFYGYDGAGNIVSMGADRYTYDGAGRLVSGTVKAAGSSRREDYTYDAFDNLLTSSRDGQAWASFSATSQNRVHHPGDGPARSWFYDVAGNLLRINKDSDAAAEIEMEYDALGMQNTFRRDHPLGFQFVVSVFGPGNRRLLTFEGGVGGGVRTYTLRDLSGKTLRSWMVSGFGAYESPSSPGAVWTFEKDYLYGPEGMFATRFPSGARRYFHADHLGTPRLITDAEGQIKGRHHYYPYGWEVLAVGEDERHCKYTGHERDPHGGTDYMLGRTYAFPNYRFMSVDPGRDGWNLYGYVAGNPMKFLDPSGETVSLYNLTEEQRGALVEGLNEFTGNTYSIDEHGLLQLDSVGENSSETATSFVNSLISSDRQFDVVESPDGRNRGLPVIWQVQINFSSFVGAEYGKVDPRTFNLGSTFTHESYHSATGVEDSVDGVIRHSFDWTGPVVDFVNSIRRERKLPTRAAYPSEPAVRRNRVRFRFKNVRERRPEKIFFVYRNKQGG